LLDAWRGQTDSLGLDKQAWIWGSHLFDILSPSDLADAFWFVQQRELDICIYMHMAREAYPARNAVVTSG
jgi:hypothetical protein